MHISVGGVPISMDNTLYLETVISLEVIDKIAAVKTGQADKPIEDIPVTFKVKKANKEKLQNNTVILIQNNESFSN